MIARTAAWLLVALAALPAAGEEVPEPAPAAELPAQPSAELDAPAPASEAPAPEAPAAPDAPARPPPWTPPDRSPAVFYLDVGLAGTDTDAALSFDAGLEVQRIVVTYSAWRTLGAESTVFFNGVKVGYVLPIHRVWGVFGAAGGGSLRYRSYPEYGPVLAAEGRAIVLEGGLHLGPYFGMNAMSFAVQGVIPIFTPGMPAGQEVHAPALMASFRINVIVLAGMLGRGS